MKAILKDAVKVIQKESNSIENYKISFDILLKAHKPFKTSAHFIVLLPNGCRWVQRYEIIFTVPPVDDKIEIVSEMNKAASARFKLANRNKNHAKFKAYFAPPSSA